MSITCLTTTTPTLENDTCNGTRTSTKCVISIKALTYLGLPINTPLEDVIDALLLSLADARTRIGVLESTIEDHETRITALEP